MVKVERSPGGESERYRTAITRTALSRPVALALDDGILQPGTTFFDYGCGRGGDLRRLAALGYEVGGWDPVHRPEGEQRRAGVVNLGYVVNVIESPEERAETLRRAWQLTHEVLIVAARLDWDARKLSGRPYGDGVLTTRGTFQRFFTQEELRAWIDQELGTRSVAAAPGVFYVFRDDVRAESYLAERVRRRPPVVQRYHISETLYEANRDILDPLAAFVQARGRPPEHPELSEASAIQERLGSIRAALALIRRVAGDDAWRVAEVYATNDLTVYLALAAFRGRPKFSQLPSDVQADVKAFFGSYKEACASADSLLFSAGNQSAIDQACRHSLIGKLTQEALYVHVSALPQLSPLLRVYEGCGRALTGNVGGTTIVKLNRIEPKVSYLAYPAFDRDPHPPLAVSVRADLRRLQVKLRDFRDSSNPPILHRKETFVAADYPGRDKFARLTGQEEKHGLLSEPVAIGTRQQWGDRLGSKGLWLRGHRLVRQHKEHQEASQRPS